MRAGGLFDVTSNFAKIAEVDVIIICVPTPLSKHREPDLGPVLGTGQAIVHRTFKKDSWWFWSPALIRGRLIRNWLACWRSLV